MTWHISCLLIPYNYVPCCHPGDGYLWKVPISICSSKEPDRILHSHLLHSKSAVLTLENVEPDEWIKVGQLRMYCVIRSVSRLENGRCAAFFFAGKLLAQSFLFMQWRVLMSFLKIGESYCIWPWHGPIICQTGSKYTATGFSYLEILFQLNVQSVGVYRVLYTTTCCRIWWKLWRTNNYLLETASVYRVTCLHWYALHHRSSAT